MALTAILLVGSSFYSKKPALYIVNEGRMADSLELVRFYNSLSGPIWFESWNLEESMDNWVGVIINEEGRVSIIDMQENRVFGTLPADLNLPFLEELKLHSNELNGSLPDFSGFPNLVRLELSRNKFTGSIPDFSNMPKLEQFIVFFNQLAGEIPDFSNLPQLVSLDLHGNQLTGEIPDFSNLPLLQVFDTRFNLHTGSIPDFSSVPNLLSLGISGDTLIGGIPDFSNLPELQWLNLEQSELSGTIPDFSNLPRLKELFLQNNQLDGNIPDFSSLPQLETLNLNDNELEGSFVDFTNLPRLITLELALNRLSGAIPDFSNLSSLKRLIMGDNLFTGSLSDFSHLENIERLHINNCDLNGPLPDFTNLGRLSDLRLDGNDLSGSIPNFSNLSRLQFLNLSANDFEYCPRFTQIPLLEVLHINNNRLTFADVLRNIGQVGEYTYKNQALIPYPCPFIKKSTGSTLGIPLYFDEEVIQNEYQWFKDGEPYLTIFGQNRLDFHDLQPEDSGTYSCLITNPNAPELELRIESIVVKVDTNFEPEPIILTADPPEPMLDAPVTIFYDITSGDAGLANCNCDIYVHTGVLTSESASLNDWRHVVTVWGVDNPEWRMTPVPEQPNLFSFTIGPSIREYYSIEPNETVEKLAFVFRNAEGTIAGKAANNDDIFYPLTAAPTEAEPLNLRVGNTSGSFEESICFDVFAQTPTAITSLDLSMQWDTAVLAFDSFIHPNTLSGLATEDIDISPSLVNKGLLTLNWDSDIAEGVSFPEETKIFELCVRVKADTCLNSTVSISNTPQAINVISSTGGCLYLETMDGIFSATCQQEFRIPDESDFIANSEYTDPEGWTNYLKTSNNNSGVDTLLLAIKKNGQSIGSVGDGIFEVNIEKDTGTFEVSEFLQQFPGFEQIEAAKMLNYFWEVTPNYTALMPGAPFGLRFFFGQNDLSTLGQALETEVNPENIVFFKIQGFAPDQGAPDLSNLEEADVQLFTLGIEPSTNSWALNNLSTGDLSGTMYINAFSFGGMIAFKGMTTQIKEIADLEDLQLSPNPNDGFMQLSFSTKSNEILDLSIVNYLGQALHREKLSIQSGDNNKSLQLSELASGIYFLQLRNVKGQVITKKFVVAK